MNPTSGDLPTHISWVKLLSDMIRIESSPIKLCPNSHCQAISMHRWFLIREQTDSLPIQEQDIIKRLCGSVMVTRSFSYTPAATTACWQFWVSTSLSSTKTVSVCTKLRHAGWYYIHTLQNRDSLHNQNQHNIMHMHAGFVIVSLGTAYFTRLMSWLTAKKWTIGSI